MKFSAFSTKAARRSRGFLAITVALAAVGLASAITRAAPAPAAPAAAASPPAPQATIPDVDDDKGTPLKGGIGLGTWDTKAEFKDILVECGDQKIFQPQFTTTLDGGQRAGGQWDAAGGVLTQSSRGTNCLLTFNGKNWGDYTYSLKARRTEGTEGFLIAFAATDAKTLYWWNIGGWGDTRSAVEKMARGSKREIPGTAIDLRIETGTWYDIKIALHGSTADCYLDGKLITRINDDKGFSALPDAGAPKVFNNGNGPVARSTQPAPAPSGVRGVPLVIQHGTTAVTDLTLPVPALDDAVQLPSLSLKTNGLKPREAFDLLGKAVGVTFTAEPDTRIAEAVTKRISVWDSRAYDALDFDLEGVNFWQAALRLGDLADIYPAGRNQHEFTLNAKGYDKHVPAWTADGRAMRVQMSASLVSTGRDGPYEGRMNVEFLVDPRLPLLSVGTLHVQGGNDRFDISDTAFPGKTDLSIATFRHGMQSVSTELRYHADSKPATIQNMRGFMPAVVATATQPLELAIANGQVADLQPHIVGDWQITASPSTPVVRGPGGSGPQQPDVAFTLTMQRLKDAAPPLPSVPGSLVRYEGSGVRIVAPAPRDPTTQTWTVYLITQFNKDPASKIIIEVPTASKEVTLPFQFKEVSLGS